VLRPISALRIRTFVYWLAASCCERLNKNKAVLARANLGLAEAVSAWTIAGWRLSPMPNVTGNEDMSCPEKRHYALAEHISRGPAPAWWLVARRVCESRVLQFMRVERQKAESRHRLITDGAVCPACPITDQLSPRGLRSPALSPKRCVYWPCAGQAPPQCSPVGHCLAALADPHA
jgi:hypothetical protein